MMYRSHAALRNPDAGPIPADNSLKSAHRFGERAAKLSPLAASGRENRREHNPQGQTTGNPRQLRSQS